MIFPIWIQSEPTKKIAYCMTCGETLSPSLPRVAVSIPTHGHTSKRYICKECLLEYTEELIEIFDKYNKILSKPIFSKIIVAERL